MKAHDLARRRTHRLIFEHEVGGPAR